MSYLDWSWGLLAVRLSLNCFPISDFCSRWSLIVHCSTFITCTIITNSLDVCVSSPDFGFEFKALASYGQLTDRWQRGEAVPWMCGHWTVLFPQDRIWDWTLAAGCLQGTHTPPPPGGAWADLSLHPLLWIWISEIEMKREYNLQTKLYI